MLAWNARRVAEPARRRLQLGTEGAHPGAGTGTDVRLFDQRGALLGVVIQPCVPLVFGRAAPTLYLHRSHEHTENPAAGRVHELRTSREDFRHATLYR